MLSTIRFKVGTGLALVAAVGGGGFLMLKNDNPANLGEKLTYSGMTILNTEPNSQVHKEEWEEIVQKYEGKDDNQNKMDDLVLSSPSESDHDRSKKINSLKEKCQSILSTKLQENIDLSDKEKLAKNWCIKGAKGLKTTIQ